MTERERHDDDRQSPDDANDARPAQSDQESLPDTTDENDMPVDNPSG